MAIGDDEGKKPADDNEARLEDDQSQRAGEADLRDKGTLGVKVETWLTEKIDPPHVIAICVSMLVPVVTVAAANKQKALEILKATGTWLWRQLTTTSVVTTSLLLAVVLPGSITLGLIALGRLLHWRLDRVRISLWSVALGASTTVAGAILIDQIMRLARIVRTAEYSTAVFNVLGGLLVAIIVTAIVTFLLYVIPLDGKK